MIDQEFQLIAYNNLVYLIRAVANVKALGVVGGLGVTSGLLVDTYVPATNGQPSPGSGRPLQTKRTAVLRYYVHAHDHGRHARHAGLHEHHRRDVPRPDHLHPHPRAGLPPRVSSPICPNFLGQQIWTFIYPEVVAQPGRTVNGVTYPIGFNLDVEGKPILSLQKLHFVYDPLVVLFTPNDLTHKYPLQPKQQMLALTNGQIQEAICWRTANVQPQRLPPANISAQQILPAGYGMDRPNIIYSSHNRPVITPSNADYLGMSVNSFLSVSGVVYNIEESAMSG